MQTINYELVKRLSEKDFFYNKSLCGWTADTQFLYIYMMFDCGNRKSYPAYTLDEILGFLPAFITQKSEKIFGFPASLPRKFQLTIHKDAKNDYSFMYFNPNLENNRGKGSLYHKNPAEAAGLLLEWCIDNGHVKIEEKKIQ